LPSLFHAALREAQYILGREELCRRLSVDAAQLDRWLESKEPIPKHVFLAAVAIVLDAPDRRPGE
jgi:hypothetical protein